MEKPSLQISERNFNEEFIWVTKMLSILGGHLA